ncbi:MAG: Gfo/Idh/MocA family oxidoreductase [Planctomycetota bacterium]|nr:Gfo/Idh/MocA family oxidoreductase [Planctomycetota bacterium]MDP7131263.1 Gfo/Idh/MocA family oxidoreductase [Planctomycetota bacterium]
MYKSAILGCRGRGRRHADAYRTVEKGRLAAACDMDESLLDPFAADYELSQKYTDAHEMLDREKPDLLHIVTKPNLRVPLLTIAHEHKVPGVIVEKPLALDNEDFSAISALGKVTSTKICVNHQLRYHPKLLELLDDVRDGKIGDVQFIDASSRLNLAGQGTHILNLVLAFNGGERPDLVFGNVSGKGELESHHPAPEMAVAQINFPNRVRCLMANGNNAVAADDEEAKHMHKRIAVYGTHGFVHWKMNAWERSTTETDIEKGEKSYGEEDDLGQAAMTDAMFDWLEDDGRPHANRLETSLAETNTVLGLYSSAIHGKPVELPYSSDEHLLEGLRTKPE